MKHLDKLFTKNALKSAAVTVILLCLSIIKASAAVEINGLYYQLDDVNMTASVVPNDRVSVSGNVVVPSTVTYNDNIYIVTEIRNDMRSPFYQLKSITLPSTIKHIDGGVFSLSNETLETAIIGCDSIGERWFMGCRKITTLVLENTVRVIGNSAFNQCRALTKVTIPNSVKTIGESAFGICDNLASVDLGNSVENIMEGAFLSCPSLSEIVIPASVKFIGRSAFHCEDHTGKGGIGKVTIQCSEATYDDKYCFGYSNSGKLKKVVFDCEIVPDVFGDRYFTSITEVVFTDKVRTISNKALQGCSGITNINVSMGVVIIGNSAFSGCSSISEIVIPESVVSIGSSVFSGCDALKSFVVKSKRITFDGNLFKWSNYWEEYTGSLAYVNLDCEEVPEGMFYKVGTITEVVLGESVKTVGKDAFHWINNIRKLSVLGTYTSINCKFNGVESLIYNGEIIPDGTYDEGIFGRDVKEVTLGPAVKRIGNAAFCGCGLTDIDLPDGLESIGDRAFSGCGFISLTIPASVTSIGEYALTCTKMKTLTSYIMEPMECQFVDPFNYDLFDHITLYVPAGTKEKYQATSCWNRFTNIIEGGGASGINPVNSSTHETNKTYNLRGQRLSAPQKGINIIGGKKMVVK